MHAHKSTTSYRTEDRIWRDDISLGTNPWQFLKFVSRPYRTIAIIAAFLVILGSAATAMIAYVFKLITDAAHSAAAGGSLAPLWNAAFLYVGLSLFGMLAWRASGFVGMRWSTGVRATARYALFSYVIRHSHAYFADRFAGSISSKISQAAKSMSDITESILWNIFPFFTSVIASFSLAFSVNPNIAFLFLVWVCVITPLNIALVKKGVPLSVETQKAETMLGGAVVDTLTNINAVHEYTRQSEELNRLKVFILERRRTGLQNWKFREWLRFLNSALQILFIGGIIMLAVWMTGRGTISAGDIVLLLTVILLIEDRLTFIGNQMNNFGDAWGQVTESLTDIIRPYDITDAPDATSLSRVKGAVTFENVSFSYGGAKIFENLSFTISAGERIGLVGRSGAGKSTLMKLLLRHQEPSAGVIRIDTTDIAHATRDSIRSIAAVVPQEPLLFHRSIRENIAYGNPHATEEEIQGAARLAQAHTFIEQLPEGYDSLVGERGIKLSGGQRQRIAIARAMLKNAPILLLDEATSSLDSESEVAVQRALLALMEGRTVIAIAHRLSTLRAMDRIVVMDYGKIVEDGTHEELLARGGLYSELWAHQAGGFLED